ncbi:MAG: helix-turn-helix domain-containing protein, partial [Eubacterium sp.]|nr:helix-turn-helix domain-containing protein [Eubacterium sp.]
MSQHLSYPERCIIERLLNSGKNYAEIARQIERSKSTVMREVKKNVVVFGVNPEHNNIFLYLTHYRAFRSFNLS